MPRPSKITAQDLAVRLMAHGPSSATDLAASLRVNPSTVTRTFTQLGPRLVTLGSTRRTRYALRRNIRNLAPEWPLYRIDPAGSPHHWGTLEILHGAWRILWHRQTPRWAPHFSDPEGLWNGFPFFLSDARPQGYLGRSIARQLSHSHFLPENPQQWNDDDTLLYLATAATDLPGNLVIGDDCLRRALDLLITPSPESLVTPGQETTRYPELAARSVTAPPAGSSAGGEQPKFTAIRQTPENHPVLVKFSPPLDQQTGRRWADLLSMEYHALTILAETGLTEPGHRLLEFGHRRFLESPRFDRNTAGGRHGIISLDALNNAAIDASPRNWTDSLCHLHQAHLVSETALQNTRRLQAFGELIGNTDMHAGNLSFRLTDTLPFELAPAYDMLPMFWAPSPQGELVERPFNPQPPVPAASAAWQQMLDPAREFWNRVASDKTLSPQGITKAQQAAQTLTQLAARFR